MMHNARAAVYYGGGEFGLEHRDIFAAPGQELVRVVAAGICGTDLAITSEPPELPIPLPAVLGHEIFGVVEEGADAGRHVVVDPNLHCGRCAMCLQHKPTQCLAFEAIGLHHAGGFADLVAVPRDRVLSISNEVPPRSAVLVEPLACVLHGLSTASNLPPSSVVVVLGGGPIGALFALVLERAHGQRVVVSEPSDIRRELLAERLGRGTVVDPVDLGSVVDRLTRGLGAALVVDAVGSLLDIATWICAGRGTIVAFGLADRPLASAFQQHLTWRELTVVSALTGGGFFPAAVELVEQGVVDSEDLVTTTHPLEEITHAFDEARSSSGLKVVIEPGVAMPGSV